MRYSILAVLALLFPVSSEAATIVASACTTTAINTAIGTAASGDTVTVPGPPCTITGGGTITIPNTKGITLDGQNSSFSGSVTLNAMSSDTPTTNRSRVTRINFTGSSVFNAPGTNLSCARWRFDNNTTNTSAHGAIDTAACPGLFDHNTFSGLSAAQEFFYVHGWGAVDTTGWTNSHTPGSDAAIYIENNTFTTPTSQSNNAWIQMYYGGRAVIRNNTFNYTRIDGHGTPGNIGVRWWEFYNNQFVQTGGNAGGSVISMRAGSGIVFNNTKSGSFLTGDVGMCEEDSGYPALYQIGRGQNQVLYPAYAWGNTIPVNVDSCEAPEVPGMVQFNRDVYRDTGASCTAGGACTSGIGTGTALPTTCTTNTGFWKTDVGGNWDTTNGTSNDGALYKCTSTNTWTLYYTPLVYPHPLISGGTPSVPSAPTNFRIIGGTIPIISLSRRITWEPGVPGGVPTRTTQCGATLAAGSSVGTIQTALNSCASGGFVLLATGSFSITSALSIPANVSLRGSGNATVLSCTVADHCVYLGAFPGSIVTHNVSGSPAKGAVDITLDNVTGLSVNDYVVIDQTNDGTEVNNADTAFGAGECRSGAGLRCLGQMVKITAINSTTITVSPSLHHAYSAAQTPQVWEVTSVRSGAGIESLTIQRPSFQGSGGSNVKFIACSGCWVKDIRSVTPDFWHVDLDRSIWSEVRDSYFNDGWNHGTGGQAYGVVSGLFATDNLIENNIFRHNRHSMVMQNGATGNVYAYNYSLECYQGGDNWLPTDMNSHGAHTSMNLLESNIGCKVYGDNAHGSSSYNTVFRNHSTRESFPAEYPAGQTSGRRAVDIEDHNKYWNVVGNVLGQAAQSWDAYDPGSSRSASAGRYVYTFGYQSDGASPADDYSGIVASTYRHGNFDYQSNSTIWDAGNSNHTLPSSLYLAAKPSWFGSVAWPAIGSDLTPKVTDIPAKDRYEACAPSC